MLCRFYSALGRYLFPHIYIGLLVMTYIFTPSLCAQDKRVRLDASELNSLKTYQLQYYPLWEKTICQVVGSPVTTQVLWETIVQPGKSELYSNDEFWAQGYFLPLVTAIRVINNNNKKALRDKLQRIVIFYTARDSQESVPKHDCTFGNGTLTINFPPLSEDAPLEHVKKRRQIIQLALESALQ